jgi:hypothetical protein
MLAACLNGTTPGDDDGTAEMTREARNGSSSSAATTPAYSSSSGGACPTLAELPAGADPAVWRCESMSATGHLTLGRIDEEIVKPMTLVFAEGRVDGAYSQVFGAMTAPPIRIGGTPWTIAPQYAGYADFQSNDERRGELDLTFAVAGPGLPAGCSIGGGGNPVHLVLKDTEPTQVISQDPLVVTFGAADFTFAAPATSGCGYLGLVLDLLIGLPSVAGANALDLHATVVITPYGQSNGN